MTTGRGILAGKRVLIVEDEYFLADDLRRMMIAQDAIVIGPVADVEAGMTLADAAAIDLAIVDVNLNGSLSYRIADRLAERAVPFALATGYEPAMLPTRYGGAVRIAKPFADNNVVRLLEELVR